MEIFKSYIGEDRQKYTKAMFKIMGTIYRGSTKGRFTLDEGLKALNRVKE